jgi:hypothetical protein
VEDKREDGRRNMARDVLAAGEQVAYNGGREREKGGVDKCRAGRNGRGEWGAGTRVDEKRVAREDHLVISPLAETGEVIAADDQPEAVFGVEGGKALEGTGRVGWARHREFNVTGARPGVVARCRFDDLQAGAFVEQQTLCLEGAPWGDDKPDLVATGAVEQATRDAGVPVVKGIKRAGEKGDERHDGGGYFLLMVTG